MVNKKLKTQNSKTSKPIGVAYFTTPQSSTKCPQN